MDQAIITAHFAGGALFISIAAFIFAVISWRESYCPIITTRITTEKGGNVASPIELIVENCGNRPAKNIRLNIDRNELNKALLVEENDPLRKSIERCFDNQTFIPVLEPGRKVTNSFGFFSGKNKLTWVYKSTINVHIYYQSLDNRRFSNSVPIWLVDNRGFALGFFGDLK